MVIFILHISCISEICPVFVRSLLCFSGATGCHGSLRVARACHRLPACCYGKDPRSERKGSWDQKGKVPDLPKRKGAR